MHAAHSYSLLDVRDRKGTVVVSFKHKMFVHEDDVPVLKEDLQDLRCLHKSSSVIVDFHGLEFFQADGFLLLGVLHQLLAKAGLTLTLCRIPPHIYQTCHLIRMNTLFAICDDLPSPQKRAKAA